MSAPVSDKPPLAAIFAPEGPQLSPDERALFRDADPFGFILFARNCETPDQIHALCDDLRATLGRDCPVLIDQEGGRVRRYKGADWPQIGPARDYGLAIEQRGKPAAGRLYHDMAGLAAALGDSGIDVNCAPVADLLCPDTSGAIGDRAYSDDPGIVEQACGQVCRACLDNGVTPVVKHCPGHGRVRVDPHDQLPYVETDLATLRAQDFTVFQQLFAQDPAQNFAQGIWAMMAHIIYTALDPGRPASLSQHLIGDIVRGELGFKGLLISDDISMGALESYGELGTRARLTLEAGCDCALYCHGSLQDMQLLARDVPAMTAASLKRYETSKQWLKTAIRSA